MRDTAWLHLSLISMWNWRYIWTSWVCASFIFAIKNVPSRSPALSAAWITLPLSENAVHALLTLNIFSTDAEEHALIRRGTPDPSAVRWLLAFAYYQSILNHSGDSASGGSKPRETRQNIFNRKGPDSKRDGQISQRRCLNGWRGHRGRDRECECVCMCGNRRGSRKQSERKPSPFHHSALPPVPEALRQITTH